MDGILTDMARLRRLLFLSALCVARAFSQSSPSPPALLPWVDLADAEPLPDSPGTVRLSGEQADSQRKAKLPPCPPGVKAAAKSDAKETVPIHPCKQQDRYRPFLNSSARFPLTSAQKGHLAFRDVVDPFNLLTIGLNSAFTIGINSHTAYGPGIHGFLWDSLYTFSQDATGEFIGTFVICSLAHEDPRYHRMPEGRPVQRFLHAISRTVIAQHDDGRPMLNVETLLTYPASAEIANLYVPGVHGNGPSTAERILTGIASDPINNIITEFLPDFARRIHIRVVFVQQIINQVAAGQT